MDRELHGHPAAAYMSNHGFSLAGNFGMRGGYESQELYSWQAASAADFHRSLEQHGPSTVSSPQQNFLFNDGKFISAQTLVSGSQRLKLSNYLFPAQELLNEFCDLGGFMRSLKQIKSRNRRLEEGGTYSSSASLLNHSLKSLHIFELQKRRANLLSMLEEVDRRYKRYCEQMTAVVSSFEAVAGEGTAKVYISLASKAMSSHFRSLRDGIVGQMQATRKAIAEMNPISARGISRGETPRLKLIDQYCFRQKKAFQQGSIFMDQQQPWRPQRGLPDRSVSLLRAWLFEHFLHPYPSDIDKHILAKQTGLSKNQVTNWFINARVRLWKPMVEEIYIEEMKDGEQNLVHQAPQDNRDPNPSFSTDPKEPAKLLIEPDSLSSIINADRRDHTNQRSFHNYQNQVQRTEHFGIADFDFSSYSECSGQSYSGNGVSLTLGLQQHNGGGSDGGGGGFSFSPENHHQFAMIDGEMRKLSYRNLIGTQLLHDLGG